MLTTTQFPQSLLPDVKANFNYGRESAEQFRNWDMVTTVMSSNNETEEMVAHGPQDTMRKWEDERQARSFKEYDYDIKNYPWEYTIALDRRLIQFDKTGQIAQKARSGGVAFEKWISKKVWYTLRSGSSLVSYDGQYFFDTDHAWSGSNQSNLSTGNSPLAALPLGDAMETMMNFEDEYGHNLAVMPDLVITGPQNARELWELTESEYTTETTSFKGNFFKNSLKGLVVPWIYGNSTQNEWYLVDTKMTTKPVIHTRVTANPEITEQGRDSYTGFNRREYQYGVYYDGGFGVGDWFTALKNGIADPSLADVVDPTDYYSG